MHESKVLRASSLVSEEQLNEMGEDEEDEKECLARGVQFLATLNEKYQGKKLSNQQPVQLEEQTLILQFEDGDTLKIDLVGSSFWGDCSCHLIVNDISIESFEADRPNHYPY